MLTYEVVKTLRELEPYQTYWSDILEETNNNNPFVEYEWISTWWEVLGRSHPVEIYVIKNGDQPIAFFPFEHTKRLGIHQFQFVGMGEAFYMQIISSEQWLEKSIQFLFIEFEKRYGRVIFEFNGLLESKATSKEIEKYAIEKQLPHSIFRIVTPYIDFNEISYEQLMKNLKKKLKSIHRRERRLTSFGELTFQSSKGQYLDKMFRLYNRRWQKKIEGSNFSSNPTRKFVETLMKKRSPSFHVEINYLIFENHVIGFTYDICCRERKVGMKIAHEPDFNSFGPGRIIDKRNLASANEQNYSIYDFGSGYEPYKLEWATNVDFNRKILISSKGKREKVIRQIQSIRYFIQWKISTSYQYVVLKRDRLGEWLHFIKAVSLKEKLSIIQKYFNRKVSILELYKLEENNLKKKETSFIELKIQDVLGESTQTVCIPYYFKGYRIFSKDGQTISYKRHDQLIRDEETGFVEQLPPNAIFIKDFKENELLKIVCELGNEKSSIWTVVNRFAWKKRKTLQSIGFEKVERISKYSLFNWQKVIRKQINH